MAIINSEVSSYKDIVLALDRERNDMGSKEISWNQFTHQDKSYSPHSVIVGKTSDELKLMGFMPTFTYDKEHLKNSMFPEDSYMDHAHGLSADILLQLPKLLNKPIAIVTERNDKVRGAGNNDYRCLHFLFATKEDDEQKYYRAIVHPQTYHNGMIIHGFATKIISFHEMDEKRFETVFNNVLNGTRQMLYFNNERYLAIDSQSKPVEFCNQSSISTPIKGHFTQDPNLRVVADNHRVALQKAVTAELDRLIIGRSTRGESVPLLQSSIKALEQSDNLLKLRAAYSTVQKITTLTPDRLLRLRGQEYADKALASSYIRVMTQEEQQRWINKASKRISAMEANSKSDLTRICDEIERVVDGMPTLKNLGVNFADSISGLKVIMNAREISGQFQATIERTLSDILYEKKMDVQRNQDFLDDQIRQR